MMDVEYVTRLDVVQALRRALDLDEAGEHDEAIRLFAGIHDTLLLEIHQHQKGEIAAACGDAFVMQ